MGALITRTRLIEGAATTLLAVVPSQVLGEWTVTGFAGVMTNDVWEEAITVIDADFLDSGLFGVGVERQILRHGQLSFGLELQVAKHFGTQSNLEINTPLTLRYHRVGENFPWFEAIAFGLGISWASEVPATEVNRNGASTQTMFYWMGELQFDLPATDIDLVTRIHHRSDGYGIFEVDSGSNALVIGLRHSF